MGTRLIELSDGVRVEVEGIPGEAEEVSGIAARRVSSSLDKIGPLLDRLCEVAAKSWSKPHAAAEVEHAELEVGIGFEGEGDLYIARLRGSANIVVRLHIKPQDAGQDD